MSADLSSRVRVSDRKTVFDGFISVEAADITRDGKTKRKSALLARSVVHIVALLDDGRVLLTRQYRYPVNWELLELPAGGIDDGESPEQAAARELLEETGYRVGQLDNLGTFITAPGSSNEQATFFLARELSFDASAKKLEDEADLLVEKVRFEEALFAYLDQPWNIPVDGKSALGLLLAAELLGIEEGQPGEVFPALLPGSATILASETLLEDGDASIERATVLLEGEERTFLAFRPRPVIEVLPLHGDGQVSCIYHYRWPVNRTLAEFPAGGIEPDEDVFEALYRELAEEAGLSADSELVLGSFYFSPGTMDLPVTLAVAVGCREIEGAEREESIELVKRPLEELRSLLSDNAPGCLYTRLLLELTLRAFRRQLL